MTQKKKILYVITKSSWGGAQRYVYDLATGVPRKEFDVAVILGGEGELKSHLESKGVRVITVKNLIRDISIAKEIFVLFSFFQIFRNEKPDIVHINSSKAGGLGALAARLYNFLPKGNPLKTESYKLRANIIFTAHGWPFNEERGSFERTLIWIASWITALLAHTVITLSNADLRKTERMPWTRRKTVLIRNGVAPVRFLSKQAARTRMLGAERNEKGKRLWIGTVAELHRNKGIRYALEAVCKISRDVRFVVVGDGEERQTLESFARESCRPESVLFAGKHPRAETLYKAFDVFLLPSLKEGLPYALLEAGMAGLPVVASAVGGIPNIVDDMQTGILVQKKNPREILRALNFLLENEGRRAQFGEALRAKVTKEFSLDAMKRATYALYGARA